MHVLFELEMTHEESNRKKMENSKNDRSQQLRTYNIDDGAINILEAKVCNSLLVILLFLFTYYFINYKQIIFN